MNLDHDEDCPARDACTCGAQGIREWASSLLSDLREKVLAIPTPKRYENDANGNWFTTDMEYGWDCAIEAAAAVLTPKEERGG